MTDHPNLAAALAAFQADLPKVGKDRTAKVPTKAGGSYCLAPETRVLTADLVWVQVGKVAAGDRLIAFDEHPVGNRRKWRTAMVEATREIRRPCYRITMADGTIITASDRHQWLIARRTGVLKWRETADLRPASRCKYPHLIVRAAHVWDQDTSWESGYVAGALDGEGSLCQTPVTGRDSYQLHLSMAQRDNVLFRTVEAALAGHGFETQRTKAGTGTHGDVKNLRIGGGRPEVLRALGTFRPQRLLGKLKPDSLGAFQSMSKVAVSEVEYVGEQTVVATQTSTRTLLAEGFASHNSYTYADLASVSATVLPLLAAQGLAWTCVPTLTDGRYVLLGSLRHTSAETVEGVWPLPGDASPQVLGGAMTYGRRYLLCALTGVAADDDDDAAAATRDHQERPQAQRRQAPVDDPWAASDPAVAAVADGFAELADQAQVKEDVRALWGDAKTAGVLGIALGPEREHAILSDYLTAIGTRLSTEETP